MKRVLMVLIVLLLGAVSLAAAQQAARIFVERGCTACHGISALQLKARSDVGPDLTFAYGDVVNRYGRSLESFLGNPTGIMRLMFTAHLNVTQADRDSIVHILRNLYLEHRAAVDEFTLPVASVKTR
jgi:mono/diheme cytochrome c family protein